MGDVLKHKKVSTKTGNTDPDDVQPSNWNEEHVFAGGALGSLPYYDPAQSDHVSWLAAAASGNVLLAAGAAAPVWGKVTASHCTFPSSGTFGYWSRTGTVLSPATAGDTLYAYGAGGVKYGSMSYVDGDNTLYLKASTGNVYFGVGAAYIYWSGTSFAPNTHASYDLGYSAALAWRDLFLSRNATIGGSVTATGNLVSSANLVAGAAWAVYVSGGANGFINSSGTLGANIGFSNNDHTKYATLYLTGVDAWAFGGNGTISGNVVVNGVGPHAIGGVVLSTVQWYQRGTLPLVAAGDAYAFNLITTLQPDNTKSAFGLTLSPTVLRPTGGVVSGGYTASIYPPTFIGSGTVTTAVTLYVAGAPTAGTSSNYAIFSTAGLNRFGGAVQMDSTLICGALTLPGGLVTYGANDSAGAGYRWTRVPNV